MDKVEHNDPTKGGAFHHAKEGVWNLDYLTKKPSILLECSTLIEEIDFCFYLIT